jgi:hypothetical protein
VYRRFFRARGSQRIISYARDGCNVDPRCVPHV